MCGCAQIAGLGVEIFFLERCVVAFVTYKSFLKNRPVNLINLSTKLSYFEPWARLKMHKNLWKKKQCTPINLRQLIVNLMPTWQLYRPSWLYHNSRGADDVIFFCWFSCASDHPGSSNRSERVKKQIIFSDLSFMFFLHLNLTLRYAYLELESLESQAAAISRFNGFEFKGRPLKV